MKATHAQIVNAAGAVVEAQIAFEKARTANDGTQDSYIDNLMSQIYKLKWLIERDRPTVAKFFRDLA